MEKETKNLWRLLMLLLTGWILVIYLAALFAVNLFLIPRSYHLAIYVEGIPEGGTFPTSILLFRPLSEFIFKHTGDYCDLKISNDFFDDSGFSDHVLKNFTISSLISAHTDPEVKSEESRNIIYAELERAVAKCDINITTDSVTKGGSKELPPIFAAIFLRDEKVVSLLLKHNVDLNNKLDNPGRKSDQMTPLEFARNFEANTEDEQIKKDLKSIIVLLESHMSSSNVQ